MLAQDWQGNKVDVIYWGMKIIWSWLGSSQASDERYQTQGKRTSPGAVANEYKNIFHQRSKFMSRNDDPPLLCSLITLATFCNLCCLVTSWVTGLGMAGHSSTGGLVHKISQRVSFDDEINPLSCFVYQQDLESYKNIIQLSILGGATQNFSFSISLVAHSVKLTISSCFTEMSDINVITFTFLRGFSGESSWSRWSE